MYLKLQILFAILSVLCVAATFFVGVWVGFTGAVICAALAFILYLVMLTFKLKNESLNPSDSFSATAETDGKTQLAEEKVSQEQSEKQTEVKEG